MPSADPGPSIKSARNAHLSSASHALFAGSRLLLALLAAAGMTSQLQTSHAHHEPSSLAEWL